MKYVVTEERVEQACATYFGDPNWREFTDDAELGFISMRQVLQEFAQTLGEPAAVPDGNDAVDSSVSWLVACASRSISFLMDEASKYEDDGSNEPLETARDIEKAIDDLAKVYGSAAPHHPTTEKG